MPQRKLEERVDRLEALLQKYVLLANRQAGAQFVTEESLALRGYLTEEEALKIYQTSPFARQEVQLELAGEVVLLNTISACRVQLLAVRVATAPAAACTLRIAVTPSNNVAWTHYIYIYDNSTAFYEPTVDTAIVQTADYLLLLLDGVYYHGVRIAAQVVSGTGVSPNSVVITLFGGFACT